MRRLVVWNVMTLDGYFEGTAPWALEHHGTVWGDELEAFSLQQGDEIGTLLFGRCTYEGMASHWRNETGAVADMMNSLEKAVITRTLETADWSNTRLLKGEAGEHVRVLKRETGKRDIFVFGSANLVDTLLARGLVDEYRICLAPIVLGAGSPLFKANAIQKNFELMRADALKSGGVILRYKCLQKGGEV
ncbi:dihydrofolate reductase family protein [Microbulbifer sp. CnH-101-E]|uniref:dihydrofolate reductase family protein n=1 Tax=unclassified Microbulbifer TaxID=2619833 RepID=UPI00403A1DB6